MVTIEKETFSVNNCFYFFKSAKKYITLQIKNINSMALNRPITHIDCFAGPGGICTGLSAARYQTLVAIEYVKSCSRDRELSSTAMSAFFWSISLVIDGTQLRTPQYTNMVNGGTTTFVNNGWHGMYDLSATTPGDKIYALDMDFSIIKNHAEQAFNAWRTQRQWFTYEWKAKD